MTAVTYVGPLAHPTTHLPERVIVWDGDPIEVTDDEAATLTATGEWTTDGAPETVADVKAWVGNDPDRATQALQAEQARGNPRRTLVDHLTALIPQED